jgi:hypothetical protein
MARNWWYYCLLTLSAASARSVLAPARLLADPPGRVARLGYMNGAVSLRPAGSDEWAAAVPNRPLTTGDRVWTDTGSRAELHVGSTAVRINNQTELDITALDDNTLQMRLAQGSVTIRIKRLDDGQVYEIDTPNGAVSFGRTGEYRVDVSADGTTSVVDSWTGGAEVTSAGSSFAVDGRQQATIHGTDSPTYDLVDAPALDGWDQWCLDRDHREENSQSVRYVSSEMTGYEDLDAYGHWQVVPDYGNVWVPAGMGPGWAPYHTGHWVWVDPWGWTWVDDAPWGYAPYHYGRWVMVEGAWAWVPGRVVARPVYAPALVAFVGGPGPGAGVGIAVGGGAAVAWFALGPEEVYHPGYAVSPGYVRQVNVTNVTNVTNITNVTNVTNVNNVTYRNQQVPGAMMATSSTTFASARPVQSAPIAVTEQIRSGAVMGSAPQVVPTRQSLAPVGGGPGGPVRMPPQALANRPVMANVAPPPAPIPFAAKQQALAANGGRPLAPAQEAQIRASSPTLSATNASFVRPAAVAPAGGGLRASRPGLPAPTHVASSTSTGFTPKPGNLSNPSTPHVPQPPGSVGGNASITSTNGTSTNGHSTTTTGVAVPHRVVTGTATQSTGTGGSTGKPLGTAPATAVRTKQGAPIPGHPNGSTGSTGSSGSKGGKNAGQDSGKGGKHPPPEKEGDRAR